MTDRENKPPSFMEVFSARENESKEIIVGGELITPTAKLKDEDSLKPAEERGWMAAMMHARRAEGKTEQQRLANVYEIAKEALKRGKLTVNQVNEELSKLGIDSSKLSSESNTSAPESVHLKSMRSLATQLSVANGMSREEVAKRPDLLEKQQELQKAIDAYKQEASSTGKTQEQTAAEIISLLESSGLQFDRATSPPASKDKLSGLDLKGINNTWRNLTENIIALEPNDPKVIDAVRESLSVPENQLIFRMMSEGELQKALINGFIGGETIPGQVQSGVTWWGDKLGDSLNQRRGKIRTNEAGGVWGGNNGIMIAVRRSEVESSISERRPRLDGLRPGEFDAYKTEGKIPTSAITDIFRVGTGRGEDEGMYKVEKLMV